MNKAGLALTCFDHRTADEPQDRIPAISQGSVMSGPSHDADVR
jgi:hypothetical protein